MTRAYIPRYPVGKLPFMPKGEVVEVERSEVSVRVGLRFARSCIEHRLAIERQVCIKHMYKFCHKLCCQNQDGVLTQYLRI
jgi:hypothetical protein